MCVPDRGASMAFASISGVEIITMIYEHIANFAGKPVKDWEAQSGIQDPEGACYALRLSYEEAEEGRRWADKFAAFLDDPSSSQVSGIVIGDWGLLSSAIDETAAPLSKPWSPPEIVYRSCAPSSSAISSARSARSPGFGRATFRLCLRPIRNSSISACAAVTDSAWGRSNTTD